MRQISQAISGCVLNISKDDNSIPSLANLCQCLITLTIKKAFSLHLCLLCFRLFSLFLVLLLGFGFIIVCYPYTLLSSILTKVQDPLELSPLCDKQHPSSSASPCMKDAPVPSTVAWPCMGLPPVFPGSLALGRPELHLALLTISLLDISHRF